MPGWYARPVFSVSDIGAAADFYVGRLGFAEAWRFEEDGGAVVQVGRDGCKLILATHWPEKVGKGVLFVSLDEADLTALRTQLEADGVPVSDGQWGYRLMVVDDPDGNRLMFPYPN